MDIIKVGSFPKKKMAIEHDSGRCGCGSFHYYNMNTGEFGECMECKCKRYPECNFGSPNQKIGNFTGQKKLGDFSC